MSARFNRQFALWVLSAVAVVSSRATAAEAVERCAGYPEQSTAQVAPIPAGKMEESQPALRLPADVQPAYEALSLTIDPALARFSGVAAIAIEMETPRSVIWLHGRDLHVIEAHLDLQGGRLPVELTQVTEGGLMRVRLPCLVSGRGLLSITWDAPFNEHLAGLYIAREKGVPYAFTQFEAIDARRAFPCFDEPSFKIPWDIELTVPNEQVAVSNSSIVSETPSEGGKRRVRFGTTPPLPSYLLAFAVGTFDVVTTQPLPPSEVRDRPLQIRGIAPKGRGGELQFALDATRALMPWLENWFGIAYPYDKLDQIAVPDFTYGAMENAGAITYRESLLLYQKGVSGVLTEAAIATTIAHEMAHQWFGDLVTLRWWTDAWLNESFATWMEHKSVEAWRPELRAGIDQLGIVHRAMESDATSTARAIRKPVEDEATIWNQFDDLTYSKGAGLLSMMESWSGPEQFQKGIQHYLRSHVNGGGSSDDLFAALGESSGRYISGPMHSFLDQPGLPIVRVRLSCGVKVKLLLDQSRDLPAGTQAAPLGPLSRPAHWQIPVCAKSGTRGVIRSSCTLLTEEHGELELPGTRCPDWVMPNANGVGYYRFSLDARALEALTNARAQLTVEERASLAANLAAAYSQGTMPAAEVIHALMPFTKDREPEVADALIEVLTDARTRTLDPKLRPALDAFAANLYGPIATRLGWTQADSDSPAARSQRLEVLRFLAETTRDADLRADGLKLGRAYANLEQEDFDAAAVAPDLASLALSLFTQEGGEAVREKLVARLTNSNDSHTRRRILTALSSLREPAITPELLKLSLDPQLKQNERTGILVGQLRHEETRAPAMVWLVAQWDALAAQIPEGTMGGMVGFVAGVGCDSNSITAADTFLRPRAAKIRGANLELEQGLDAARLCKARKEAQGKSLAEFFSRPPSKH
jgi:alanyl aminopeptidase